MKFNDYDDSYNPSPIGQDMKEASQNSLGIFI